MEGKEKCEWLKNLRRKIAHLNGIDYEPVLCDYDGDCPGHCPQCDREEHDLMRELRIKEAAGEPIRIDTSCIEQIGFIIDEPTGCEDEPEPDWDSCIMPPGNICDPGSLEIQEDTEEGGNIVGNSPLVNYNLFDVADDKDS